MKLGAKAVQVFATKKIVNNPNKTLCRLKRALNNEMNGVQNE